MIFLIDLKLWGKGGRNDPINEEGIKYYNNLVRMPYLLPSPPHRHRGRV